MVENQYLTVILLYLIFNTLILNIAKNIYSSKTNSFEYFGHTIYIYHNISVILCILVILYYDNYFLETIEYYNNTK